MARNFLGHTSAYFMARAIPALVAIPAIAVYTRLLTVAEFGIYIAAMTTIGIAQSVLVSWLGVAALRLLPQSTDRGGFLISAGLCFAVVIAFVTLIALAAPLAGFEPLLVAAMLVTFFAMSALDLLLYVSRADLDSTTYLWASAARAIVTFIVGVAAVLLGYGAAALILANLFGSLPVLAVLTARTLQTNRSSNSWRAELRGILQYGLPLAGAFAAEAAMVNADRMLLAALRTVAAVGIYGSAHGLSSRLLTAATDPVGTAGFSIAVQKLEQDGRREAAEQLGLNLVILAAVGVPVTIGIAAVASDLCSLLLGPDFRQEAARLLPATALIALFIALRQQFCEACFHFARRTRLYFAVTIVTALLTMVTVSIGVIAAGAIGAAYGMLVAQAAALVLTGIVGVRVFPVSIPLRDMGIVVATALAMAMIVQLVPAGYGLYSLLGRAFIGSLFYAAVLLAANMGGLRTAATVQAGQYRNRTRA